MTPDEALKTALSRRSFIAQGSAIALWPASGAQAAAPAPGLHVMPLDKGWTVRDAAGKTVVAAAVPGFVQGDLVAAGKLPSPLYAGMNLKQAEPVAEQRWTYRTSFTLPAGSAGKSRHDLVFDGLDCFAEVFLNGRRILVSDNAFLRHRVPVAHLLRPGANRLEVRLDSARQRARQLVDAYPYYNAAHRKEDKDFLRKYVRKAQYQFGWDWARELNTVGIWRGVRLESWEQARIADVQVYLEDLSPHKARVRVECHVEASAALQGATLQVTVAETGQVLTARYDLRQGFNETQLRLEIDQPKLWWPVSLGAQDLYRFEVTLGSAAGTLARAYKRTGLRTTELVQTRDSLGQSYFMKINGLPVFQKGANYIPIDMLLPQVGPQQYRQMLQDTLATHMNTLRVWGGAIYEEEVFYDLCDELGVMVYQDFMFASGMPPADEAFLRSVRREAEQEVLRLRNHPCVVLWAGDNENESSWFEFPKGLPEQVYADYARIQHQLLPAVVRALSPEIPYTRSSPSANVEGVRPNTPGWGDTHAWGVWFGKRDLENEGKDGLARYASEYGFIGYPPMRSLRKFLQPAELGRKHPAFRFHDAYDGMQEVIDDFLQRYFRVPEALEDYVYLSGVMQGEAIRVLNERYRRHMPSCMGALIWQLNDVWPVASWALIDHYGEWKAAAHFTRESFAPLLLSPVVEKERVRVYLASDLRAPVEAKLELELVDFSGERTALPGRAVRAEYGSARVVADLALAGALQGRDPRRTLLAARCIDTSGRVLARNLLYFKRPKDLALPPARLRAEVAGEAPGGGWTVRLASPVLARYVFLDSGGIEGHWADNYFDLLPGEPREVVFRPAAAVARGELERALSVRTLADVLKPA